jgi:Transposase, Mutator family
LSCSWVWLALAVRINSPTYAEPFIAPSRTEAICAPDTGDGPVPAVSATGSKYDKAADCLTKDRDALLAFYDFPAEHWKHSRTTNPIESTFATVRHRTVRSKGCLSNKTALAMVFKLVEGAQKTWRRIDGHNQLPKLILGVKFADGDRGHRHFCRASSRRLILQAVTKIWR